MTMDERIARLRSLYEKRGDCPDGFLEGMKAQLYFRANGYPPGYGEYLKALANEALPIIAELEAELRLAKQNIKMQIEQNHWMLRQFHMAYDALEEIRDCPEQDYARYVAKVDCIACEALATLDAGDGA